MQLHHIAPAYSRNQTRYLLASETFKNTDCSDLACLNEVSAAICWLTTEAMFGIAASRCQQSAPQLS